MNTDRHITAQEKAITYINSHLNRPLITAALGKVADCHPNNINMLIRKLKSVGYKGLIESELGAYNLTAFTFTQPIDIKSVISPRKLNTKKAEAVRPVKSADSDAIVSMLAVLERRLNLMQLALDKIVDAHSVKPITSC